jgi:hypothetical protein
LRGITVVHEALGAIARIAEFGEEIAEAVGKAAFDISQGKIVPVMGNPLSDTLMVNIAPSAQPSNFYCVAGLTANPGNCF